MTLKWRWSGLILACVLFATSGCGAGYRERAEALFKQPAPYPSFIDLVYPRPGSVVSPGDDDPLISGDSPTAIALRVHILPLSLLRPGDNTCGWGNVRISLDERHISGDPDHLVDLAPIGGPGDSRGCYADTVTWELPMAPGIHVADVVVWTSTGEEFTYSWAFEVVP